MSDELNAEQAQAEQARVQTIQDAQKAAGRQVEDVVYNDYFGFDENITWELPGQDHIPAEKRQYIKFKRMTEGMRAKYQHEARTGVVLEKITQNTILDLDQAAERVALIKISVKAAKQWRMMRRDSPNGSFYEVGYSDKTFDAWLDGAAPDLIDKFERVIRDANPWLTSEQSSEDLEKERDRLDDLIEKAKQREQEKDSSPAR